MRIAYCISAYTDVIQLDRLISSLNVNNVCFIVHIDKKVKNITAFNMIAEKYGNVSICKERFFIQWGGWNQVRYQELFMNKALRIGADRIVIITGQDYPLWNNEQLWEAFEKEPDKIYMCGLNLTNLQYSSPMYELLAIPHFGRDWHIRSSKIWRILTAAFREFMLLVPYKRKRYLKIDGIRWDIWQASGYFSVNREQAEYILKYLRNKRIRNYFRFCFVPEEITIPTILFNSPYKANALVFERSNYEGLSSLAYMHIFEYGREIKVYCEEDYNVLINSKKMFARKFRTMVSDKLMDMIDTKRMELDK